MSQYFDKDLLKFVVGFVAIIIISWTLLVIAHRMQGDATSISPETQQANP